MHWSHPVRPSDDRLENPRHIETRWAERYRYVGRVEEQFSTTRGRPLRIENAGMKDHHQRR